jgi:hypothetical protein
MRAPDIVLERVRGKVCGKRDRFFVKNLSTNGCSAVNRTLDTAIMFKAVLDRHGKRSVPFSVSQKTIITANICAKSEKAERKLNENVSRAVIFWMFSKTGVMLRTMVISASTLYRLCGRIS